MRFSASFVQESKEKKNAVFGRICGSSFGSIDLIILPSSIISPRSVANIMINLLNNILNPKIFFVKFLIKLHII